MSSNKPIHLDHRSPFRDNMDLEFVLVENGRTVCEMDIQGKHLNAGNSLHGGAAFTLMDAGMGNALRSMLREDQWCVTAEIKVSFFKAVSSGRLVCESQVLHKGKRTAFLESEIRQDGTLVAKASGTFSIIKK